MRVANPPDNPTLLFDAECGFCRRWVARLAESSVDVDTRPCQESLKEFPELTEADCLQSVRWIGRSGEVAAGADAALRFWATSSHIGQVADWLYRKIPGFAPAAKMGYRLVAKARPVASYLSLVAWGPSMQRPTFRVAGDVFLRVLGLIYVFAFFSLFVQVEGLIGTDGILPATETLQLVGERIGGLSAFHQFPTVLWLWSTDTALLLLTATGAIAGAIGIIFPYTWVTWVAAWVLYLSFVTVGRTFLSFQWDALLLETGFLVIVQVLLHARGLTAGTGRRPYAFSASPELHRAVGWTYRWLLFRLMFASGVVKLVSGDILWHDLTALTRHYETQPLPNMLAWYAHHLPESVHVASCVVMFAIELVVPFLFFAPTRLRNLAAVLTVALQTLIVLTGNYTFFNLLTIALCLWLIEDLSWPRRIHERFGSPLLSYGPNILRRFIVPAVCLNLLISSLLMTRQTFSADVTFPDVVQGLHEAIVPFRLINSYGLFSIMTVDRPEIILEGSQDGTHWEAYEFYYKPGDVKRPPPFVAPHQPRLDWQMWFAALGPIQSSPWFFRFVSRLLEGSEPVKRLLAVDPFPGASPRYLRAQIYDYRFTVPEERAETGYWWARTHSHTYLSPIRKR